jgi:hypothetical protein
MAAKERESNMACYGEDQRFWHLSLFFRHHAAKV